MQIHILTFRGLCKTCFENVSRLLKKKNIGKNKKMYLLLFQIGF